MSGEDDDPVSDLDWDASHDGGARKPDAAVPEALPAGLLPRDAGDGAGFAAGGVADSLPPGVVLAGFAGDAWAAGLARVSDDELIGLLRAWHRLTAWTAAGELAAVAELDRRRDAEVAAGADPHLAEHVGDELAVPLTLTTWAADRLLEFAHALQRLPLTRAALAAGRIDRAKALVIADEVSCLDAAHAAAVETAVIGRAPDQTTGQLRAAARRAALAADPAASRKQREKAEKQARVEVWSETGGTAALAGRDLPPAEVIAADQRIDALARQLQAAGLAGSLDQLRARAYTALLLGRDVPASSPPGPAAPASGAAAPASAPPTGMPGQDGGDRAGRDRAGQDRAGGGTGVSAGPGLGTSAPAGLAGSVNLIMPLATWLGGTHAPADVADFGAVPADDGRALADLLAARPGTRWCLTLTGQDGRAVAHGCAQLEHGGRAGAGSAGRQPWSLTVRVTPLAAGSCPHDRESAGYQPSAGLRHAIVVRHRTCSFPGCRRSARRCDQDHTIPFDQGGRTCECNLSALCRRHHRAKQAQGWRLEQPEPGVLVWTLPHGRSYRTGPGRYP